jgi:hypothetical protein
VSLGHYLVGMLGLAAVVLSLGFASRVARRALLPGWEGAPALLADAILAIAMLVVISELLGLFGLLQGVLLVAACLLVGGGAARVAPTIDAGSSEGAPARRVPGPRDWELALLVAIAVLVVVEWGGPALTSLDRGMYGGDTLWYHMPFAAHFAQTGSVTQLLFTDPLYMNWFYPQNSELLHAAGLLLLGNDFLSPLINMAWLGLALLAAWCCGRPYGAGAPAAAGVAALLSANLLLSKQPGNANNDAAGIALLVSSVAIILNDWWGGARGGQPRGLVAGPLIVAGLAAGLALGTKLTLVVPVAALTLVVIGFAARGSRWRVAAGWTGGVIAGGGFWYARNLVVSGNPLPWMNIGPLHKAGELHGRKPFSIAHYLTDTSVWGKWFVPGLHERFGELWPLALALAVAGVVVAFFSGRRVERMLAVVAALSAIAYLLTPLSAAGPEGSPVAFRLNLRYLAPALSLAFVLLAIPPEFARSRERQWRWAVLAAFCFVILIGNDTLGQIDLGRLPGSLLLALALVGLPVAIVLVSRRGVSAAVLTAAAIAAAVALAAAGRGAETHYLKLRYSTASPDFPVLQHPGLELSQGLGAAYDWARGVEDARIGLSGSLGGVFQYGLWGLYANNEVRVIGRRGPRGTFTEIASCPEWVQTVNDGDYEYLITTPDYNQDHPELDEAPVARRWMERAPSATRVVSRALVDVWRLDGPLDPAICAGAP